MRPVYRADSPAATVQRTRNVASSNEKDLYAIHGSFIQL